MQRKGGGVGSKSEARSESRARAQAGAGGGEGSAGRSQTGAKFPGFTAPGFFPKHKGGRRERGVCRTRHQRPHVSAYSRSTSRSSTALPAPLCPPPPPPPPPSVAPSDEAVESVEEYETPARTLLPADGDRADAGISSGSPTGGLSMCIVCVCGCGILPAAGCCAGAAARAPRETKNLNLGARRDGTPPPAVLNSAARIWS